MAPQNEQVNDGSGSGDDMETKDLLPSYACQHSTDELWTFPAEIKEDGTIFDDGRAFRKRRIHGRRRTNLVRRIASASSVHDVIGGWLLYDFSSQSLDLIFEAIKLKPSNIWVWESRRRVLELLDHDLHKEMNSVRQLAEFSAMVNTSFNVWYHRSWIADRLGTDAIKEEVEFTKKILSEDPNNSYAWDNLVDLAKKIRPHGVCEAIEFTGNFLCEDAKNSYVWYCRSLLVMNLGPDSELNDIHFTRKILCEDAENECAWCHILNLVENLGRSAGYDELNFIEERLLNHDAKNKYAWFQRRQIAERCLMNVKNDFADKELQLSRVILRADPNNKYAWFHRQWVFDWLGINAESKELQLTCDILSIDAKSSYAWFHRQWVLRAFGRWKDELAFCDEVLEDDICNDFAWNQKFFVLREYGAELCDDTRKLELKYALKAISKNLENRFPWMYLKFLYRNHDFDDSIVEAACISTLSGKINGIKDLSGIKKDRRLYVNALDMVLDVISCGYQPSHEMRAMITELCSSRMLGAVISNLLPVAENSISAFVKGIRSVLQYFHPVGTVVYGV